MVAAVVRPTARVSVRAVRLKCFFTLVTIVYSGLIGNTIR
jgi:hypothetical protein